MTVSTNCADGLLAKAAPGSLGIRRLPGGDPAIDERVVHIERYWTIAEHDFVKVTDVESRAERLLGTSTQLENSQLTGLINRRG